MNKKNTKQALLSSVIALLLCVSMLVGTTFAWFTDSVTSGNNNIIAGNLDVELYNGLDTNADKVDGMTTLFGDVELWEPGAVAYENLTVANVGTLALKYQLAVNFLNENATTDGYKLSQILKVGVVENGIPENTERADAVALVKEWKAMASFYADGELSAGEKDAPTTDVYGLVIYWEPSADDNNWNVNNGKTTSDGKPLHIDLGINLVATQKMEEDDSFGIDYDENAWADAMVVLNEADLTAALANGGKVLLAADIAVTKAATVPAGKTVALNLNGYTLSAASGNAIVNKGTLTVTGGTVSAAAAYAISNSGSLTVDGATLDSGVYNTGYMVVESGKVFTTRGGGNHAVYHDGTMLIVNGGEFSGNGNEVISATTSATAIINGGTFDKVEKSSYLVRGNRLKITGGTFYAYDENGENPATHFAQATSGISGGTFNYKPSKNLAPGYTAVEADGLYYVVPDTTVAADLYIVNTTQLVNFAKDVNGGNTYEGKTVALIADIDLADVAWTPINGFKGIFNGNGKTISNLTVKADKYAGLFGYLKDSGATISNLTIDGANVEANTVDTDGYAGALVGYHYSSGAKIYVDNVTVTNSTITGKNGGAVAGATNGAFVSDCTSQNNTITASRNGGIIGKTMEFGSVTGSTVSGNTQSVKVFSDESYVWVGTVVGQVAGGTVEGNDTKKYTLGEAATQDDLQNKLSSGTTILTLDAGNYTLPTVSNSVVSISGDKDTVITVAKPAYHNSDITFNGVTVKGSGYATGVQHVDTVTYNDVAIVGEMCLYGNKVVFNNCTFELAKGQYLWTYGAKEVEFINCTFNTAGKAILVYNEGDCDSKVTVKGCTFNATVGDKAGVISNQNCAAIELDNYANSGVGQAHVLITEGNTYSDNFSGEWRIKNFVKGNPITVNGVQYTKTALDGKLMTVSSTVATFD